MSDDHDDITTHRIPVRIDDGGAADDGAGDTGHDEVPASPSGPGLIDIEDLGSDPVIVSMGDEDFEIVDEDADPEETDTVPRDRHLELMREKIRLDNTLKKVQTDLYNANAKVNLAEKRMEDIQAEVASRQAEFQNFRRRIEKEREEDLRYANQDLLEQLLPVIDSFGRALEDSPKPETIDDFYKGMLLVQRQLDELLAGFELAAIDAIGKAFDPNFHEGISRTESATVPADHIVTEMRRGYMYKDRLLRASMVAVSSGGDGDSGGVLDDEGGSGSTEVDETSSDADDGVGKNTEDKG